MSVPAPHFLLHSRIREDRDQPHWSFSLKADDESLSLAVEDAEPDAAGERLELLAVVRGLEAIPIPSRLTLVTSSTYVNRVLDGGLDEWRSNGWKWERHGEMVPVKNHDLWRRVDRALRFHQLHARRWRLDAPHTFTSSALIRDHYPLDQDRMCRTAFERTPRPDSRARKLLASVYMARRQMRRFAQRLRSRLSHLGKAFAPCP